jgi:hypothetical protein
MKREIESWVLLVHVYRRWRGLVFKSPRRLNLQLCCYTPRISARETLDVWPALPLLILGGVSDESVDDAVADLQHSDRISQINLECHRTSHNITSYNSPSKKLWTAMQAPFPELTALHLSVGTLTYTRRLRDSIMGVPVLPDSFLGGSAPRLRYFYLDAIPFPGLPKLLLSATHLLHLHLQNVPHSGYISPEAMVTCLSMLTSLQTFQLEFGSPQSYPGLGSRCPFIPTRSVLPTLTIFSFKGVNEYLEEFAARIDAPQLYRLSTTLTFFSNIDFKASELRQFIRRTPTLGAYDEARLIFLKDEVIVRLRPFRPEPSNHRMVQVKTFCTTSDRQLSNLTQICTLSLRGLLTMEDLYIDGMPSSPLVWDDDIENTKWLDLLLPFTAVENLYLSQPFSSRIALALNELTGGRTTEALPVLQNVLLEGFRPSEPIQKGLAQFISARQLTNHPVAISVWHRNFLWD